MRRSEHIAQLQQTTRWDIVIIGGGATGLGAALDAAARGYKTLLVERSDFAQGTSSRSTKLIHGGVRYLEQGNIKLVKGALRERFFFLKNAPELTRIVPFILPVYQDWKLLYFWIGLKLYDLLSGKLSIGGTRLLSAREVSELMPSVETQGLRGGVMYYDGQFDDSGMCIALANTAAVHGATVLNYVEAQSFLYTPEGKISGLQLLDRHSGRRYEVSAAAVINATGVFADALMRTDNPAHKSVVKPSRGIHLVVSPAFFEGSHALLIPRTTDGRVLFVVPWMGKVVIGTTDVPVAEATAEPLAGEDEVEFILHNFNQYCRTQLRRSDVLSVFAGLRPLVRMQDLRSTSHLLRDHALIVSASGLITITGGKWTTYRKMAKDAVNKAAAIAALPFKKCPTRRISVSRPAKEPAPADSPLLHPDYPFTTADVRHAVCHEMALTVEDVLARRLRLQFLDSAAAKEVEEMVREMVRLGEGETL